MVLFLIPYGIAFLSRGVGAATAMGIFPAAWIVQGIQMLNATDPSSATGVFLLLLALCLLLLTVVRTRASPWSERS